eukprot:TRINITY_DN5004_c0_g1_i5.p1 TRINITY_DN5004_c0_g1~~TRINITY_DN5004_c0_g1_i5.p1  ORF type:complete len:317 (-),score=23.94 TRINITY_DN5004_c0_g1_i5:198-1037(-)
MIGFRELATILWSLCRFNFIDNEIFEIVTKFIDDKTDEIIKFKNTNQLDQKLIQKLIEQKFLNEPKMCQSLCTMLWSLSLLEQYNEYTFNKLSHLLMYIPRQKWSTEDYLQIYESYLLLQEQDSKSSAENWWWTVFDAEIKSNSEKIWRETTIQGAELAKKRVTHFQLEVYGTISKILSERNVVCQLEMVGEGGIFRSNIGIPGHKIAISADGPFQFARGHAKIFELMGDTRARNKLLDIYGWQALSIPFFQWQCLESEEQKEEYVRQKISTLKIDCDQ